MQQLDTILFDFDGTLAHLKIDFDEMRVRVRQLIAEYGVEDGRLEEFYALELADEARRLIEAEDPVRAAAFHSRVFALLVDIEMAAAACGSLIPCAVDTLRGLRREGWKVGIITRNSTRAVGAIVEGTGLPYDALLSRDMVARVKPHPDHLRAALDLLDGSPERTVLVGDGTIDVIVGRKAGVAMVVGVLTGVGGREELLRAGADCVIESIGELRGILKAHRGRPGSRSSGR